MFEFTAAFFHVAAQGLSVWWMMMAWPPAMVVVGLAVGSLINVVAFRLPRFADLQTCLAVRELMVWSGGDSGPHQARMGLVLPSDEGVLRQALPLDQTVRCADLADGFAAQSPLSKIKAAADTGLLRWLSFDSRCPECHSRIAWWALVPFFGWFFSRGRCTHCGHRIDKRYPTVELGVGLLWFAIAVRMGHDAAAPLWALFVSTLCAASLIDWDTKTLPDELTQGLVWTGIALAAAGLGHVGYVHDWVRVSSPASASGLLAASSYVPEVLLEHRWLVLMSSLLGAILGYAMMWCINVGFRLVSGVDGMGQGDFKLMAAVGAWLGVHMLMDLLLLSSIMGAIVHVAYQRWGRADCLTLPVAPACPSDKSPVPAEALAANTRGLDSDRAAPFGPAICAAAIILVLIGRGLSSPQLFELFARWVL